VCYLIDSNSGSAFVHLPLFHQVRGQSSTDKSIQERHKARHTIRDKRAGGVGLGVLETKSKHFKAASLFASASAPSQSQASPPPKSRFQLSPAVTEPQDTYPSRKTSNLSVSVSLSSHEPEEYWTSPQQLPGPDLTTDYLNCQLNGPNASQMASVYMDQPLGFYEIENMYHGMTFDMVHFNETSFAPQLPDYRPSTNQALPERTVQSSSIGQSHLLSLVPSPINNNPFIQYEAESQFSTVPDISPYTMKVASKNVRYARECQRIPLRMLLEPRLSSRCFRTSNQVSPRMKIRFALHRYLSTRP
jgi:hypothetical protein